MAVMTGLSAGLLSRLDAIALWAEPWRPAFVPSAADTSAVLLYIEASRVWEFFLTVALLLAVGRGAPMARPKSARCPWFSLGTSLHRDFTTNLLRSKVA